MFVRFEVLFGTIMFRNMTSVTWLGNYGRTARDPNSYHNQI